MFFRRGAAGPDSWLTVKMVIFVLGAALAVIGISLDNDWLVWAAILVLAAGVILRLLGQRPR